MQGGSDTDSLTSAHGLMTRLLTSTPVGGSTENPACSSVPPIRLVVVHSDSDRQEDTVIENVDRTVVPGEEPALDLGNPDLRIDDADPDGAATEDDTSTSSMVSASSRILGEPEKAGAKKKRRVKVPDPKEVRPANLRNLARQDYKV